MKIEPYLFARWLVMHYTSEYLNKITGAKWKELYMYYSNEILPDFKKNGSYKNNKEFLKSPNIEVQNTIIKEVIVEVPLKTIYVPYESNGCDCGQMHCVICHG